MTAERKLSNFNAFTRVGQRRRRKNIKYVFWRQRRWGLPFLCKKQGGERVDGRRSEFRKAQHGCYGEFVCTNRCFKHDCVLQRHRNKFSENLSFGVAKELSVAMPKSLSKHQGGSCTAWLVYGCI